MAKSYLQLKYHPAKKEIEFRRFENGKSQLICEGRLLTYINKKGSFVLQDHGNQLFKDIAKAFDSVTKLEMKVITTKMDYEDLKQMINRYNEDPETQCKIMPTLVAELPDMKKTFEVLAEFGKQAVDILKDHKSKLFDIQSISNKDVKDEAESLAKGIDEVAQSIKEKIEGMSDHKVKLCFTGVYSVGKSALINAMLGYRILPEGIASTTAKMFNISSPKPGEAVKIIFNIDNVKTVLEWDENKNTLEFKEGPHENDTRANIQKKLNENDEKAQHEQISSVLDFLNGKEAVSHKIEIQFPIPLDSEAVQYTIYDTPGTDSNFIDHQEVLVDALSKQTHSILIFVVAPNKIEGTGNNALLTCLKEVESKDSKMSIDLDRSLFVINSSDTIDSEAREKLKCAEIKFRTKGEDDEPKLDFSITLSDKKLFFTSAKLAYAAKAKRNGVASPKEDSVFKRGLSSMQDKFEGFVYRQNHCASSELATDYMHSQCEAALEAARSEQDDTKVLEICSGIYALEREIQRYGKNDASAVNAYAIIDSLNKVLGKLSNRTNELTECNQKGIDQKEKEIETLKRTINSAILDEYNNKAIAENAELPEETLKKLKLDEETLQETIVSNVQSYMDKELHEKKRLFIFNTGKTKPREGDHDKIRTKCNQVISTYTTDFLENKRKILKAESIDFLEKVKHKIQVNGEISEAAKKFILEIPAPKVPEAETVRNLKDIYNAHKYTEGKWIFKTEYLDKSGFMKDVKRSLLSIVEKLGRNYREAYKASLNEILDQIKSDFEQQLNTYSIRMKTLIDEHEAMLELGNRVLDVTKALQACQNELNAIIWKEVQE